MGDGEERRPHSFVLVSEPVFGVSALNKWEERIDESYDRVDLFVAGGCGLLRSVER
jgi:hypothetical protein